jgi:hypothetical protein
LLAAQSRMTCLLPAAYSEHLLYSSYGHLTLVHIEQVENRMVLGCGTPQDKQAE